ncbi:hypothetical protein crov294 [Cafeteria roenbergensis virus]|uniref:Uncharacterized protein n=1 Tax=Cafeteria roenbergensis virus (strain BV-PW1) TaxID=693272 RepID=E3T564_CROVB|nr:hypothetical protein crov294 [Cafeteria roenbergensis virus BV-PW1]ADO67327.1 hypothetical protein crov294 [Cafeteria roenbergensis virus BV-PW1]
MSQIYVDFKDFLKDNDIIVTIIATIVSSNISMLSKSFMKNLVMPIINIDLNNDGIPDRQNLDNWVIHMKGVDLKIGQFLLTFIEFFLILIIIYLINKLSKI